MNLSKVFRLVFPSLVLLLFVAAILASAYLFNLQKNDFVSESSYQMIVLDDGKQYFGHLKNLNTTAPYLSDVYYIRDEVGSKSSDQKPKFILIKLGSEIQGSDDLIYLNWDKVQFWTNLREDSQVVNAIDKDKEDRKKNIEASNVDK